MKLTFLFHITNPTKPKSTADNELLLLPLGRGPTNPVSCFFYRPLSRNELNGVIKLILLARENAKSQLLSVGTYGFRALADWRKGGNWSTFFPCELFSFSLMFGFQSPGFGSRRLQKEQGEIENNTISIDNGEISIRFSSFGSVEDSFASRRQQKAA